MGHIEEEEENIGKENRKEKRKERKDCREWKLLVRSGALCGMSESYGYQ